MAGTLGGERTNGVRAVRWRAADRPTAVRRPGRATRDAVRTPEKVPPTPCRRGYPGWAPPGILTGVGLAEAY